MQLENKVAIITGAGQGIGYCIAESMARSGVHVVIGEILEELGTTAAKRLTEAGYSAESFLLDVTKTDVCQSFVNHVISEHGRIDILVNNAGLFILHKSEDMPEEDWRIQIDVMLNGTFFMTQCVGRVMIEQAYGSIVNIASIGGMGGWPMRSAYNAAKAGVITLTEVLSTEWAQYNIRLNCVSPGVTRTEMLDSVVEKGDITLDRFNHRIPLGRVAETQDIANAVLFLASDRARYITGTNLRVDGGWVPWGNLQAEGFPADNKKD